MPLICIEISVGKVTYFTVTYEPKIDGQTFWLIFLALNIRANERETVTYKYHRLLKKQKMSKKKNLPKSDKNMVNWVIEPVEFRKTGDFATWGRLVARDHDFTPKMKVFLL